MGGTEHFIVRTSLISFSSDTAFQSKAGSVGFVYITSNLFKAARCIGMLLQRNDMKHRLFASVHHFFKIPRCQMCQLSLHIRLSTRLRRCKTSGGVRIDRSGHSAKDYILVLLMQPIALLCRSSSQIALSGRSMDACQLLSFANLRPFAFFRWNENQTIGFSHGGCGWVEI